MHWEFQQIVPPVHVWPQVPQFSALLDRSTHEASHAEASGPHVRVPLDELDEPEELDEEASNGLPGGCCTIPLHSQGPSWPSPVHACVPVGPSGQ
jgi:hypothetical protein